MNPEHLDPDVLAHLAHIARARREQWRSRLADSEATAESLAELLADGQIPALGWWRDQFPPRMASDGPLRPSAPRNQPWEYADLVLAAEELAGIQASAPTALELLAEITLLGRLGADALRLAFELFEELR